MILRRVIEHFKNQEWTGIFLDFLIVVAGVFIGVQVSNWNNARADQTRADLIIEALRQDLRDGATVEERFIAEVGAGLAAFDPTLLPVLQLRFADLETAILNLKQETPSLLDNLRAIAAEGRP